WMRPCGPPLCLLVQIAAAASARGLNAGGQVASRVARSEAALAAVRIAPRSPRHGSPRLLRRPLRSATTSPSAQPSEGSDRRPRRLTVETEAALSGHQEPWLVP